MQFNLKEIEEMAADHVAKPLGIPFLDNRIEEMRNPQGHVADYYSFFYEFTKRFKPNVVVELGSWQGTSAACFAAGDIQHTSVFTIDHHTDLPNDAISKDLTLKASDAYENLHYYQGWTCPKLYEEQKDLHSIPGENAFPKLLSRLNSRKIDVLFIDSWHEYHQAKKDWDAYKPLLNDEALIICDDILEGTVGSGIDNMQKFWDEMEGEKFLNNNLHQGYPMGFLKWTSKD
jgi:predicted O-methyltransferase YrrM